MSAPGAGLSTVFAHAVPRPAALVSCGPVCGRSPGHDV